MSEHLLHQLGVPLLEMRCPYCHSLQQLRSSTLQRGPCLTRCCTCQQLLVYQLSVKTKPNHLLLMLDFFTVTDAIPTTTQQEVTHGTSRKVGTDQH